MSDTILSNSIWPNGMKTDSEGYACFYPLGDNKTPIPTSSSEWPKGNKLVSPFVYQDDKLVGFCDTKAMTVSGSGSTTMPYTHIEADFASIEEGKLVINAPNATTKKFTWAVVPTSDGSFDYVFVDFNTTDQETINAVRTAYRVVDKKMYDEDGNVIGTWDTSKLEVSGVIDLENEIVDGVYFSFDPSTFEERGIILTEFDSDLSSLTEGGIMFCACFKLTTFTSDLSSLTDGCSMFSSCFNLTTFTSDLSSLTVGENMFYSCSSLTTFTSDLSSLTNSYGMFDGCKLNASSVKNIIDTINTASSDILMLGMGCNDTEADKDLFAQEVGYTDMTSLLAALQAKGWNVNIQCNGRPTTTYDLRRPSENTLPVFVKLEETEEYADYTSIDGSKKYRLTWFHETTGSTDGYTQFNSLEEAIETFNIKQVERH